MRDNNLAYNSIYYDDIPESPLLRKATNTRSSSGVKIKADKNKRLKLVTSHGASHKEKHPINKGTVLAVIVLSAMAFFVLFRGLMLQSGYDKLEEKNAQLEAVIAENQRLQFKIDQTLDLENIETIAKNTYNMGAPTKAQTVYINLDEAEQVKKVTESNGFFDGVADFFGGIVEYFS